MIKRLLPFAVLVLPALLSFADDPQIPTDVPDKAATRKQIDDLITSMQSKKEKATLGLLQQCMELSISYGAPAWNQKDHEECCNFYIQTAKSLTAAFPDDKSATAPAAGILNDLKTALTRVNASKDIEQNAWTLRYVFDKTQLAYEVASGHGQALVAMGSDYLARKDFADAEDAFTSAEAQLAEMHGRDGQEIPAGWRVAPLALANALLGDKKYRDAADAITRGVLLVPEWPQSRMDLADVFHDPAFLDVMMSDLKAEVRRTPNDANLQFLLGYEFYFSGDKESARPYFEKALQLDPKNAPAKAFLKPPPVRT